MKKNYFTMLLTMVSFAIFAQVNVVKDTLRAGAVAVFNAEYTAVASDTGVTFTLNLEAAAGDLANVAEVEIYRSYVNNRVSGRTRIQRFLPGSSGTVVFVDESQVWTADAGAATGYTGDGAFNVGVPTAYSVKVIMADESSVNSQRTVPTVRYSGAPTRVVNDVINDDMVLQTRVYENHPSEDTALLVIGLAPSVNYPTKPYDLLAAASLARQNPGYVNWQSYPAFISEILYNEVSDLSGRNKDNPSSRAFWSNEGVVYHLVKAADIKPEDIAADGTTNVSFKVGRPNSSQPANGFSYNSLVSVPMQIQASTLSLDSVSKVSTLVKAIDNKIKISNVIYKTEIKIYSITGALLKSITTNDNVELEFNTGLYIATVSNSEGQKSVKLLVQ
ncbi:MAG: T9SS type A sorting domain-containing protein [Polaribacter sp.]